jgi:hypothetical protein
MLVNGGHNKGNGVETQNIREKWCNFNCVMSHILCYVQPFASERTMKSTSLNFIQSG